MTIETDCFFLDDPIETEIGECHFIRVRQYPKLARSLNLISWSKSQVIYNFHKLNKDGSLTELIDQLKPLKLHEIARLLPELNDAYTLIFKEVFKDESVLNKIDENNFDAIRSLILKMSGVKEEVIIPNLEIQEARERSKRVKAQQNGGVIDFSDMASSIVSLSSHTYRDLPELTLYQFYQLYYRIAQIKAYDTTTLFATVPSEKKAEIEDWSKHIDLFKEESHSISKEQMNTQAQGLFGNRQ
ncbi:hypothetical protein FZC83_02380 [Rossellomorea marisflavi]|uniref:Uncharacterized protein n=1 Tax=Rossellomorea marisflavi TaxID=189381 RepID=A0A5D4S1L0_9BACI|nr:hypothetical protein [Rossellomorea marisflavi]TYS56441.1 hypothetical protein FZC83_02380 [Rossellomorea marisflavi]